MFDKCKNTKKQGDIGLGKAIAIFSQMGYTVSIPLTDSQDYDLIVDIENKIYRVQVKTTMFKTTHGIYQINLAIKGGNKSSNTIKKFDNKIVDALFVLTEIGDMYFIPSNDVNCKHCLNLGKDKLKYKIKL